MERRRMGGRVLFAALCAAAPARAQDEVAPVGDIASIEGRSGYVEAVGAIVEGREREALVALAALAERHAGDPDLFMLHYNVACAHARLGEQEAAFAALARAIDGGYPLHPQRLHNLLIDVDLASLRETPRFAELLDHARTLHETVREGFDELTAPYEWVPPPPEDPAQAGAPLPLLIVLHPYGEDRRLFAQRWFEPFCARHGFALFAPGGIHMIAPERFAWFAGAIDFMDGFRGQQRRIVQQLGPFRKRVNVDPERIYVAGFGQGAGLAFAIAVRNPQWVRGAVLFQGGYAPSSLEGWIEPSVGWGRRIAMVHADGDARYPLAPLESFAAQLESRGLAVRLFPAEEGARWIPAAVEQALAERLPWIDEVPFQRPPAPGR